MDVEALLRKVKVSPRKKASMEAERRPSSLVQVGRERKSAQRASRSFLIDAGYVKVGRQRTSGTKLTSKLRNQMFQEGISEEFVMLNSRQRTQS